MKLQTQHFLLSYLKTLSAGPVGVSNSRPPASQPGAQPSEQPVRGQNFFKLFIYAVRVFEYFSLILVFSFVFFYLFISLTVGVFKYWKQQTRGLS